MAKSLCPGVVFRRSDVNEHSALLESVNPVLQQIREYVLFQTGWPIGNLSQDSAVENIDSAIYQSRALIFAFLNESSYPIVLVYLNSSITRRVWNGSDRHAHYSAMLAMKFQKLAEVEFQE